MKNFILFLLICFGVGISQSYAQQAYRVTGNFRVPFSSLALFYKNYTMSLSKRLFGVVLYLLYASSVQAQHNPVRVACVGNSITYGFKLPDPARDSYPSQLQRMLGDGYEVGNFGHSGATLLRHGYRPYFDMPEYKQAMDFKGDVDVIHLGINDTDPRAWPNLADEFVPAH